MLFLISSLHSINSLAFHASSTHISLSMEGTGRRTWNRQEFQLIAQQRLSSLSFSDSPSTSVKDFYCSLCKCGFSDQGTFLDHINSWKHRDRQSKDKSTPKNECSTKPTVQGVRSLLAELCQVKKEKAKIQKEKKPKKSLNPQLEEMKLAGFLQDYKTK